MVPSVLDPAGREGESAGALRASLFPQLLGEGPGSIEAAL